MQFFLCFCRLRVCSLCPGAGTSVLAGGRTQGQGEPSTASMVLVLWNWSPGCLAEGHRKGDGRGSLCAGFWPLQVESCSVGMVTDCYTSWLLQLAGQTQGANPNSQLWQRSCSVVISETQWDLPCAKRMQGQPHAKADKCV